MSQALVIPKSTLSRLFPVELSKDVSTFRDNSELFNLPLSIQPRSTCETDPNYVQILPYIVIKDESNHIFSYRRGKAGGESRLMDKCSIGFGGHVEETLEDTHDRVNKVSSLLALHTLRELNEEVDYDISYANYNLLFNKLKHGDFSLIYSTQNEVDKYHLCLYMSIIVDIAARPYTLLEYGIINDSRWMSKEELKTAHEDGSRVLEGWSEILLNNFI